MEGLHIDRRFGASPAVRDDVGGTAQQRVLPRGDVAEMYITPLGELGQGPFVAQGGERYVRLIGGGHDSGVDASTSGAPG